MGVVSGGLSYEVMRSVPLNGSRSADLLALALGSLTWAAAVAAGLWLLRSELPADLRRKKPAAFPRVAEGGAAETMATGKDPEFIENPALLRCIARQHSLYRDASRKEHYRAQNKTGLRLGPFHI